MLPQNARNRKRREIKGSPRKSIDTHIEKDYSPGGKGFDTVISTR